MHVHCVHRDWQRQNRWIYKNNWFIVGMMVGILMATLITISEASELAHIDDQLSINSQSSKLGKQNKSYCARSLLQHTCQSAHVPIYHTQTATNPKISLTSIPIAKKEKKKKVKIITIDSGHDYRLMILQLANSSFSANTLSWIPPSHATRPCSRSRVETASTRMTKAAAGSTG